MFTLTTTSKTDRSRRSEDRYNVKWGTRVNFQKTQALTWAWAPEAYAILVGMVRSAMQVENLQLDDGMRAAASTLTFPPLLPILLHLHLHQLHLRHQRPLV